MGNSGLFILITAAVIVFIVLYSYMRQEVIDVGEKSAANSTRGILSRFGLPRGFKVLSNISLKNGDEELTSESILIGYFGILLVRTLGSRGEYYGTLDSESWTLVTKDKKHILENPIKQLKQEESALRHLFSKNKIYNVPIEKVVYVSNKSAKTAVYVTHSGEILLGGKLQGYMEKTKFDKDNGLDVKNIADVITGAHD